MKPKGRQLVRSRRYFQWQKSNRIITLDVKGILESYFPNIFYFISIKPEFESIRTKLKKKLERRLLTGVLYDFDVYRDADFYDLLYMTTKIGDQNADQFLIKNMVELLRCYNALCGDLNIRLSTEQKEQVKSTFLNILRTTNNEYIHYVGELLVLNFLLSNGFVLEQVAYQFGNLRNDGSKIKDADFLMYYPGYDERYLVEVYNRHISSAKSNKLKNKLQQKLNDTLKDGNTTNFTVCIQPVIWCKSIATIIELAKDIGQQKNFKIENVWEPLTLFLFYPDGQALWGFINMSVARIQQ